MYKIIHIPTAASVVMYKLLGTRESSIAIMPFNTPKEADDFLDTHKYYILRHNYMFLVTGPTKYSAHRHEFEIVEF